MSQRRYKQTENRQQITLLPKSMDEYVSENNPVRAIDAYVDALDMEKLGLTNSQNQVTAGQPAYPPAALVKLYIYGYLNRVRSSRRLEKESCRNIELMWLLEGLKPSYKTIANFRKDNAQGLQEINKKFVVLCKELSLFGAALVAIDGSFFQGNASLKSVKTRRNLEKQLRKIEQDIALYQETLDEMDTEESRLLNDEDETPLAVKIEKLKNRQRKKKTELSAIPKGEKQQSKTDKDARLLCKRGHRMVGYNVQTSVDSKHKLIVHHEVINAGNDSQELYEMGQKSKSILGGETLIVVADSGYYNQEQLYKCAQDSIETYVAIPNKSHAIRVQGRYTRDRFKFDESKNAYYCPAGQELGQQGKRYKKRGKWYHRYASKSSICNVCPKRKRCLKKGSKIRQLTRSTYEKVASEHRLRMDKKKKEMMALRASLVEHPFGTMKRRLGALHFLVRGFEKTRGEMSLIVFCYNFSRVMNIIGVEGLLSYFKGRETAYLPG